MREISSAVRSVAVCSLIASAGCVGQEQGPAVPISTGTTTRASVADGRCTASAIAMGDRHTCILRADGTVRCFGSNAFYQLGLGTVPNINYLTPQVVPDLANVVALAAGNAHTCALLSDGTVSCWGRNNNGQLGDGTFDTHDAPNPVPGLTSVVAIAAGSVHTCALKSDGTVWCWGSNGSGRLGDGTTTRRSSPVQVTGLAGASAITIGNQHTCALVSGAAYCWGANTHGQLGDGTRIKKLVPTLVSSPDPWRSLSAGQYHTCGVHQNRANQVECWGRNNTRQLGDETATANRTTPAPVHLPGNADPGLTDGVQMASGGGNSCVILGDGSAWCWGKNTTGQVGDNTRTLRNVATLVQAPTGLAGQWLLMARGLDQACGIAMSGSLYCWGHNGFGQLGNGTRTRLLVPTLVAGQDALTFAPFTTEDEHDPSGGSARASSITSDGMDTLYAAGRDQQPGGDDAWIVRSSADRGATWTTRSTFTYAPGKDMTEPSLVRASSGNLYIAGAVTDSGDLPRWLVRRSIDGGDTWETADDFAYREGFPSGAVRGSEDTLGGFYVAGYGTDAAGLKRWVVRGTTGGALWTTVDDYAHESATSNEASHAIDAGDLGQLVIGHMVGAGGARMLIRQAPAAWTGFAVVDDFQHAAGHDTVGLALAVDAGGRLFAIARAGSPAGVVWIVRRSLDGGATWSTADTFQLEPGEDATPNALFIDRSGAVQVAGTAVSGGLPRAVLRTSYDHGVSWVISDLHGGDVGGAGAGYLAIAQDIESGLHVAGVSHAATTSRWTVRARACECHRSGTCEATSGICTGAPDGTACSDGNACTQTDTCTAASCTGADPVICSPLDSCHVAGACSPSTGLCTNPIASDGTLCDDGDLCTQDETCSSGVCTGATTTVCSALDQCHVAGTCDPGTGACSNPAAPNGTSCDDADACTSADSCQTGACTGAPISCDDANVCTNDTCSSATGCEHSFVVAGTGGPGTACDGADGDLCNEGAMVCDGAGGTMCNDTSATNTESCNSTDDDCDGTVDEGGNACGGACAVNVGDPCDGADADLCTDDVYVCSGLNTTTCAGGADNVETCNGVDDDCDGTVDEGGNACGGACAITTGACDGADADLCSDDTYVCTGLNSTACPAGADNAEACNGADDDCDGTVDEGGNACGGACAITTGACDGADTDLCSDDTYVCTGLNSTACSAGANNAEACNGADDDCDGTVDEGGNACGGACAITTGACDGADADFCSDDSYVCTGLNSTACSAGADNAEACNGADDDCDGTVDEGGNACGGACPITTGACDGADSDFCADDGYFCTGLNSTACSTGGDNYEVCNGVDDDCNGGIDDGSVCGCPYVYSFDGEEPQYETSIGGASLVGAPRDLEAGKVTDFEPLWVRLDRAKVQTDARGLRSLRANVLVGEDEIAYFDSAHLTVVEHEPGFEIVSSSSLHWAALGRNDPQKLYAFRTAALRAPEHATWMGREDVTAAMATLDDRAVSHDVAVANYYDLDLGAVTDPSSARLIIDGWKLKVDRGLGVSVPQEAPRLEAKQADGTYKKVLTLAAPRGDRKAVVFDLSGADWPTGRYEMRLWTGTHEQGTAIWPIDRVRLTEEEPERPVVRDLSAQRAKLTFHGAPTMLYPATTERPLLNTDDGRGALSAEERTFGRFTRYGDVKKLLVQADDALVVMRRGDAVELTFGGVPRPAKGKVLTFFLATELLFKPRVCVGCGGSTALTENVEPLPFHGMVRYPPEVAAPARDNWVERFNTREYLPNDLRWGR